MQIKCLPPLIRFSITIFFLFLIPLPLLRIGFWLFFEESADPLTTPLLLHALYVGLKFDVRLALVILLPLLTFAWIKPVDPFHSRLGQRLWTGYLTLMAFLLTLTYLFDFGHFAYLHVRLNSAAVQLLEDTAISVTMLWETYPVVWILLVLFAVTLLYGYLIDRLIRACRSAVSPSPLSKKQKGVAVFLSLVLVLLGLYGKISYYPLRWSDAFFSTNAFAASIALNPALYLYDTFAAGRGGKAYDEQAVTQHYDAMADYLGMEKPNRKPFNFTRQIPGRMDRTPPPNIVVVQLESFSYQKTSLYDNPLDPTPHFKALAQNGLLFTDFYTPHMGTARAVFASLTGIPDVETHNTSTRNPVIVCQQTIVNAFKDHKKFYFIGGSASWGNIRGLLSHNIPDLALYEEGSYASPRVDVWGISDLALFEEAHQVLKRQERPFFAVIQTAGNHRPHTIPEDRRGFEIRSVSMERLIEGSFESSEQYNAFRFLDHSIDYFIKAARQAPYFENTIFVFFGDHGIQQGTGKTTPRWETQLNLTPFHIPFLIYAPKWIPEGKIDRSIGSSIDILPTLAGLTGTPYKNTTLGRDLLDPPVDSQPSAFTIAHATVPEIGLLQGPFYFVMHADGTNKRLHRRDAATPRENLLSQHEETAARMAYQLTGIHETAKYMLYHNNDNACKK